jgi:hypothetical protein
VALEQGSPVWCRIRYERVRHSDAPPAPTPPNAQPCTRTGAKHVTHRVLYAHISSPEGAVGIRLEQGRNDEIQCRRRARQYKPSRRHQRERAVQVQGELPTLVVPNVVMACAAEQEVV